MTKILLVDDDENLLKSWQRQFRQTYDLICESNPHAAIDIVHSDGPFAVVISDMQMPEMDGITLLKEVKKRSSDTIRVLLTGSEDQRIAIQAINEGKIFRFLAKPCSVNLAKETIDDALRFYDSQKIEKDLLENTVKGSIAALKDIISISSPHAFNIMTQVHDWIEAIVNSEKSFERTWELDMASMIYLLGWLTVPAVTIKKIKVGASLTSDEEKVIEQIPQMGHDFISKIPRLEKVARVILYYNKEFDGSGFPKDAINGPNIPSESRLLKILNDLASHIEGNVNRIPIAINLMKKQMTHYDPDLFDLVASCLVKDKKVESSDSTTGPRVKVINLMPGDIVLTQILDKRGMLILAPGSVLSKMQIMRLQNLVDIDGIEDGLLIKRTGPE